MLYKECTNFMSVDLEKSRTASSFVCSQTFSSLLVCYGFGMLSPGLVWNRCQLTSGNDGKDGQQDQHRTQSNHI